MHEVSKKDGLWNPCNHVAAESGACGDVFGSNRGKGLEHRHHYVTPQESQALCSLGFRVQGAYLPKHYMFIGMLMFPIDLEALHGSGVQDWGSLGATCGSSRNGSFPK